MGKIIVKILRGGLAAAWLATASLIACGGGPDREDEVLPAARWQNSQGVVYMDQHNYVRGLEHFEQAASLDPSFATAHANGGIALYSLGKYDSARVRLTTALQRDPDHLHARYTLGLIEHAQGRDYETALGHFRRVAVHDDEDPLVHYYLGRTQSKVGHSDSAVAAYRRAIDLDATHVSAHYALAQELRQQGDMEAWRETLDRFNQLSQAGLEGVSSSYQGQGKYAEAIAEGRFGGGGVDRAAPFRFEAVGSLAGGRAVSLTAVDADADGQIDIVAGGDAAPRLYINDGGRLQSSAMWTFPGGFAPSSLSVADVDDDGDPDLAGAGAEIVLALQLEDGSGRFETAGSLPSEARQVLFGDVDHDGDSDLLTMGPRLRLWSNDGTGQLTETTQEARVGTEAAAVALSDFDGDRDVDVVAGGTSMALFSNNRDGSFTDVAANRGLQADGITSLAVADIVADGNMDIVVSSASGTRLFAGDGASFASRDLSVPPGLEQVAAADFDNDGDLDLLWSEGHGVRTAVNVDGTFGRAATLPGRGPVLVLDVDGDGRLDVVIDDGVHRNQTEGGRWLAIDLNGLGSNPDGFGAKVEVVTAQGQQKRVLRGGAGDSPRLHFGLGESDSVEFVRVLWPSGVRQTELASAADRRLELTEVDRKGTSCPILYAWDGERFGFVSDFLGGAIIGYLTAPGQYYSPDTDEYLPLPDLRARDGRYVLQVANQLEEIIYLDAAELVAVDHPGSLSVVPHEGLRAAPPYPSFRTFAISETRGLRISDGAGRDVTSALSRIDDVWYEGFERSDIHGYAEDESVLILELGDLRDWPAPLLLAHGWVDYAHSSGNWAAAQRGLRLSPPRLEADYGQGWQLVTEDMGTPAGLPKTMVVDLEGVFPADTRQARLRITAQACVYWDRFVVARTRPGTPQSVHRRPFAADLHWRGYPAHESIKGTFAFRYDYDRLRRSAPWGTHGGGYTRLGDVSELVEEVDDRFAILFHGDELTLEIDAAAFPPLPPGWQRSFLFYADGFGKDMDFHSAHSLTVEPLPFHAMSGYPYGRDEHYPTSPEHLRYVVEDNTRWVKGYYR